MLYTNTSNAKSIVGLLITVVAVTYVANHADEIVEGVIAKTKTVAGKAEELLHYGKLQYAVAERHYDGTIHDTGKRVWR